MFNSNYSIFENENQEGLERLADFSKTGKKIKWQEKKNLAVYYSSVVAFIEKKNQNLVQRVRDCGSFLTFWRNEIGEKIFVNSNFCKDRLCPMCQWRRSINLGSKLGKIFSQIDENEYSVLFLTLTVRSCKFEDLKPTLDAMFRGFSNLIRNNKKKKSKFSNSVVGYFKTLEVTVNRKANTFHPHFHLVLVVRKDYFSNPELYLSQNDFCQMWKKACKLDYLPVVDVRAVKSFFSLIREVSKYSAKSYEYLTKDFEYDREVVKHLRKAFYHKRFISYGGLVDEIRKKLNIDENESEDAELTDNVFCSQYQDVYAWDYGVRDYFLVASSLIEHKS